MPSNELEAMTTIEKALEKIQDKEALNRVLTWASSKFGVPIPSRTPPPPGISEEQSQHSGKDTEIPGIAVLDPDGKLSFTFSDVKAKSAIDAGVRLTLVAAYVHERLTGTAEMSRKNVLVPLLTDRRVYNGNTRNAILRHKGIIRKGRSELKLDSAAKKEAQQIIKEILDPEVKGKWSPAKVRSGGRKAKKAK